MESLLMLVVGTCLFMVAGFIVCVGISIFCDSINLGGSFDAVAEKLIAVAFIPVLAVGRGLDVILWQFVPSEIKYAIKAKV